ncbi:polysaccharide deacetylase family protein [Sedimentibacter sp.]|uniref:polysaccharide deacetylase family protein n=1 Tax=Sedimentibacter sp. TaxID=1960295 RepID=UPI0028AD17E9|nr:polysaccharide deacetylase family protein [Sedimentibacter sp.]
MTKRILTLMFALMMILLMSTDMNVAQANIYNDDEVYSDTKESIKINEQNTPGKVQYTITEAQGPIVVDESINKRAIDPNKPMIAITYDDGPSKYTPEILNTLKENNSVATFFVLGSQVHGNKDILNRMIGEGNQIGNHTYNHKNLTTISDEELYKQIQGTDDLIYIATGYTPTVVRPPYGTTSEELNKKIQKPIIQWSIDTRDWESRNAGIIVENILKDVKDGDIILMHDLYDSTVKASKIVIPELIQRGFQLVTIDELSEYREVVFTAGVNYYHMYK